MDIPNMLSGDQLVAKGITKIEATLPEIGLKDILPNGSWLEQKQIQAALEARKHLVEVERIEKCGALSYAEWREDLMLAEVTRKAGSYWQYMGHNVGKHLFLQPEEALFLMEVNSLLLKHNEITVSLQKAYSLLLGKTISIDQYKVYASLSRLGYKVFRHKDIETNKENKTTITSKIKDDEEAKGSDTSVEIGENNVNEPIIIKQHNTKTEDSPSTSHIQTENTNNLRMAEAKDVQNDLSEESDVTSSVTIEDVNMSTSNNYINSNDNIIEVDDNMNEKQNPSVGNNNTNKHTVLESSNVDPGINAIDDGRTANENSGISSEMEVDIINIVDGTSQADQSGSKVAILKSTKCGNEHSTVNYRKRKNDTSEFISYFYQTKIQKLQNRKFQPCNMNNIEKYFENIPNLCNNNIVTVQVPQEQHIPKNIFVNKTSYTLNLEKIQCKSTRPASTESTTYSVSDEVNDDHVRRLSSSSNELPQYTPFMNARFPRQQNHFRPYNFWRPRLNFGYYQFNLFFQKPFLQPTYFSQRAHFQTFRPPPNFQRFPNPNYNNLNASNVANETPNDRKRGANDVKAFHLQAIKNLALRIKTLYQSGNVQTQNINSLHRLLDIYNTRYDERLILTNNLDIINNKPVIETIELDDGEESKSKKSRLEDNTDEFNKHLNKFKALAAKLKALEAQNRSTARHRRAFSNALKTFNKSYNADIYLSVNYEIIDRKHITLDSSSESDCVVEEVDKIQKGKKLRNPFNILKRLSEKLGPQTSIPSTSKGIVENDTVAFTAIENNEYYERLQNIFDKKWLPDYDDFGRAELVPKLLMNIRLLDTSKDKHLYDFMKTQKHDWQNWMDIKMSFLRHIQEIHVTFPNERTIAEEHNPTESATALKPIIGPNDCTDMPSILKKLRIIETNREVPLETTLNIDFDVYSRDVQNFRKKNRPKAHFRVICKNESTSFPSAEDISALQSKYNDSVAIVIAVVGVGSISYLQLNPVDLPVYVPSNDLS